MDIFGILTLLSLRLAPLTSCLCFSVRHSNLRLRDSNTSSRNAPNRSLQTPSPPALPALPAQLATMFVSNTTILPTMHTLLPATLYFATSNTTHPMESTRTDTRRKPNQSSIVNRQSSIVNRQSSIVNSINRIQNPERCCELRRRDDDDDDERRRTNERTNEVVKLWRYHCREADPILNV